MILLLGGTSETATVAEALAASGYRVLVSLATDIPLAIGSHPNISERRGRLNAEEMAALIRDRRIRALVDVSHPYAEQARATASSTAARLGISYFSYLRPAVAAAGDGVLLASSHQEGAVTACAMGKPVLLTIGAKNVQPYAAEARSRGITLIARVLDDQDSVRACREAGIADECIVTGRGPFGIDENRGLLRRFGIGVLVTKDSGEAGGVSQKLEAARMEDCKVVVVGRPANRENAYPSMQELVRAVQQQLPRVLPVLALDLESVLIPEIWNTVAQATGVKDLARTTREVRDYEELMRTRLQLCREHGLTLMRLREIVASMEPLPGALQFLEWAQSFGLVTIVTDTFHELASPVLAKLGCHLTVCNWLTVDKEGFIDGYALRHESGKRHTVTRFQRLGFRVFAVGDSYNDLAMLEEADAGILLRPPEQIQKNNHQFGAVWNFSDLQTELQKAATEFS